jgi:hypothetical protein
VAAVEKLCVGASVLQGHCFLEDWPVQSVEQEHFRKLSAGGEWKEFG